MNMRSSRTYELLSSLDRRERQSLRAFLRSEFSKAAPLERALLEEVVNEKGEMEEMEKETLWQRLKPGLPYKDQRMRLLLSGLLKQIHRFLALAALEDNPGWEALLSLRRIGEKGLEKHFLQQMKKTRKAQAKRADADAELHNYLLESELTRFVRQNPRQLHANYHSTVDALDKFYLLEKLRLACAALNNQYVVDLETRPQIAQEISALFDRSPHLHSPLIQVLHQVMRVFENLDEDSRYPHLQQLLQAHAERIPPSELGVIYTYVQNYCIRQINRGRSDYLRELFLIYCRLLDRGLLLENGQLSPWHFKNIVVVALRLQEYQWTEAFIQDNVKLIPKAFRENARTYNLAKLYFHKGDYSQVKKLLLQVEYEDVFYNLDSKTMLAKIYYEEGEDITLDAFARTFLAYLRRNQLVSKDHRTRYSNFIRFVVRMSRMWKPEKEELDKMEARLYPGDAFADVAWLREELAKRRTEFGWG